jgi:hypothetical protein
MEKLSKEGNKEIGFIMKMFMELMNKLGGDFISENEI